MTAHGQPLPPPTGAKYVVNGTAMDLFCDFVSDVGIPLVFGLNAGFAHGVRDEANDFAWLANSSDGILRYLTSPSALRCRASCGRAR